MMCFISTATYKNYDHEKYKRSKLEGQGRPVK